MTNNNFFKKNIVCFCFMKFALYLHPQTRNDDDVSCLQANKIMARQLSWLERPDWYREGRSVEFRK